MSSLTVVEIPQAVTIITRQSLANEAAQRWRRQYADGRHGQDKLVIADRLDALGEQPNPDDVDAVIGNSSWTRVPACDNCGRPIPMVAMVGEPWDYESNTAHVCRVCVQAVADALDRAGGAA